MSDDGTHKSPAPDPTAASRALFQRAQEAMLGMFRIDPKADPAKTVEAVTEKVLESQRRALDMMTGMAQVWTDLAQTGGGPGALEQVLDRTADMMSAGTGGDEARKAWDAWREQGEHLLQSFMSPFEGPMAGGLARTFGFGGEGVPSAPQQVTAFLSSPGFGLTREYQNRLGTLFGTWLDLQKKEWDYRQSINAAWTEAFRTMAERLAEMTQGGQSFEHPRALLDTWVKVADEVFTHHFHTAEFSRIQSEMLNAAHRLRRGRRELTEDILVANDLPTRSEVEAAHRTIYELRKELRSLKREIAALREQRAVTP